MRPTFYGGFFYGIEPRIPYGHGVLYLRDFAETDFSMVPTLGDLLKRKKLFNISGATMRTR